jgi:FtsH-binding integral membrane protein
MVNGTFNRYSATSRVIDQAQFDEGLRAHMMRVYNYMATGLVATGLVAFVTFQMALSSREFFQLLYLSPLRWVVILAPLGFVFFLSARINSLQASTARMVFWAYAALMGLSLSSIFLVYAGADIARVFFITAAMFGGMSLYGYTTRTDLARMGSFMVMGLIGIVIASVVNIFIGSTAIQFAVSVIGVIVFTGLTAWDTQDIKQTYAASWGPEATSKLAVMGALRLYLDFINLFMMMLRLLGNQRN